MAGDRLGEDAVKGTVQILVYSLAVEVTHGCYKNCLAGRLPDVMVYHSVNVKSGASGKKMSVLLTFPG